MATKRNSLRVPHAPQAREADYEIGYGRPPRHTQFEKGRSGNPRGRPKGSRNRGPSHQWFKQMVLEEAYREITVREGDRQVTMPALQAAMRRLTLQAVAGNKQSLKLLVDSVRSFENENRIEHQQALRVVIEYKAYWTEQLARRNRTGETGDEPVPHPDDIEIDFENGTFEIHGPMTEDQKALWDWVQMAEKQSRETIAALEKQAERRPRDRKLTSHLEKERSFHTRLCQIIDSVSDWQRHNRLKHVLENFRARRSSQVEPDDREDAP